MGLCICSAGGAIVVAPQLLAPISFDQVTFSNNSAYEGGALMITEANVSLMSCVFDSNRAAATAGAFR